MPPSPRIALFPGTFDPLTNGHLDLIRRAAGLFDRVVVSVLVNADKRPLFSVPERMHAIRASTTALPNVTVESFGGLLVAHARETGASVLVRGVRGVADFEYEWQMALMNRHLDSGIDTVFLMPSEQNTYVSSRLVREIAALGGRVDDLVPPAVADLIAARRRSDRERPA